MTTTEEAPAPLLSQTPCLIELMGRRTYVALASEVEVAGARMLRLDIPLPGGHTHPYLIGAQSIYAISPMAPEDVTESAAAANEATLAYAGLLSPAERARFDLRQAQVRSHVRLALDQPYDDARAERVRELH